MDVPCILSPIYGPPRVAEEPRIMETLEPQERVGRFEATPMSRGFSKWLEKRRGKREKRKREGQAGGEHLKKMLRGNVFWR